MTNRKAIETLDRTFRDILGNDRPFGGKIMIFGGDFRQVVHVVVGGTRSQAVQASIVESYLWPHVTILPLVDNIRAQCDSSYAEFILCFGNGEEPKVQDDMIKLPDSIVISWEGKSSILVDSVFPDLNRNLHDADYIMNRAFITPLNDEVNKINDIIIDLIRHDDEVTYYSFDSVPDDNDNLFLPEF